jgi:hypothetical protein
MRKIRRLLVALMVVGMVISGTAAAFADAGGVPNENADTVRICHTEDHVFDYIPKGNAQANKCEPRYGGTILYVSRAALNGHPAERGDLPELP